MNPIHICALTAAGHLLLQAWPRLINRYFGVDCWRHMLAAEYIHTNRSLPRESLPNYLFRGPFDYPPLLAFFLAVFPSNARLVLQAFLSPLIEAMHGILVFTLVFQWTSEIYAAFWSHVMFAVVPITVLENSQLNARSLGSLFLSIGLVGGIIFSTNGDMVWLGSAIVAGVLIHLTHKMATQTAVLLALLSIPLVSQLGAITLLAPVTLLITLGLFSNTYQGILKGHMAVLKYYKRAFSIGKTPIQKVVSPSLIGRLVSLAKSNPIVTTVGANAWALLIFPALFWIKPIDLPKTIYHMALFWIGALYLLIYATTVIKPMRFLGDGPRYSYYLAFPVAILGGPMLSRAAFDELWSPYANDVTLITAITVLAGVIIIQIKTVLSDRERSYRYDVSDLASKLKKGSSVRAAVFPLCTAEVLTYFSGCRVLSTDSALVHAENDDFAHFNPWLQKPLDYYCKKYEISHIICPNNSSFTKKLEIPKDFRKCFDGRHFTMWVQRQDGKAQECSPDTSPAHPMGQLIRSPS